MAVDLTQVNYILLKADGSVLAQSMDYYIQQGNIGDTIFFGGLAAQNTDTAIAVCTLPNGQQNTIAGVWDTCTYKIDGVDTTIGGFKFTLGSAQTNYNGGLMMALVISRSSTRLVSYPLYVVINETGLMSDTDTGVTVEEINTYLQQVQNMLRIDDGIVVVNNIASITDWSQYQTGQLFYCQTNKQYYEKIASSPYYQLAEDLGILGSKNALCRYYLTTNKTVSQMWVTYGFQNKLFILRHNNYDYLYHISSPSSNVYNVSALNLNTREFYYRAGAGAADFIQSVLSSTYKLKIVTDKDTDADVDLGNHNLKAYSVQTEDIYSPNSEDLSVYADGDLNLHGESIFVNGGTFSLDTDNFEFIGDEDSATVEFHAAMFTWNGDIIATQYYVDSNYVPLTSNGEKVYGTDELGNQITYDVDSDLVGSGAVVRRETGTGTVVVGTPTSNTHATTKKYVDDKDTAARNYTDTQVANAISSGVFYKGSLTVAQLNALDKSTLKQGWMYNVSDNGTLTSVISGTTYTVEVIKGDNVVWTDGIGWDKMTLDLSVYDDKFIAAGFFEVQAYNEGTGEITFIYASDLYSMSYDSDTGIMTIQAN